MANAHVPEGVQYPLVGKDAIGGDKIIENLGSNVDHILRHKSLLKRSIDGTSGWIGRPAHDPVLVLPVFPDGNVPRRRGDDDRDDPW
jgi:hypothetical protein